MKNALVIGATGLLGSSITHTLCLNGWNVRAISRKKATSPTIIPKNVEFLCGDYLDEPFLFKCLDRIDTVFFCTSNDYSNTTAHFLDNEIAKTIQNINYLLKTMINAKVPHIIFPSSGGAVYGNIESGRATENTPLLPITPYGMGKKISEDIVKYYSQYGITATILRIGNVYGSPHFRMSTQGVIDCFVQKALAGEHVTIWGDALYCIRDYLFYDDFASAIISVLHHNPSGVETFNLSTGVGTTLNRIIEIINNNIPIDQALQIIFNNNSSPIKRVVLNPEKIMVQTGWNPSFNIEKGIIETIKRKRALVLKNE